MQSDRCMEEKVKRGLGRLGPVGSVEVDSGMLPVEFEIRYRHQPAEDLGLTPQASSSECLTVWISALNDEEIPPGEYYLHAEYGEPVLVSNQNGEWRLLPWKN
jgi:hypothetical protein